MATPARELEHDLHAEPQGFWRRYVFSQDHKVIGIQYTLTALLAGMAGLALSWTIRLQLGFPGRFPSIDTNLYYQSLTQHGMIMVVYLLTALLLGGFGNYLIPLMIGARDMAYPFLNMLSYWFYLLSVVVLLLSFLVPGGPSGAGWTLYPPQAILGGTPGSGWGVVLLLVSIAIFVVSATMGALNYLTTVLQLRTRGMTLMRMPLLVWGVFLAAAVGLLAFPALFVGGVMLLMDKLLGTSFFMPEIVQMSRQLAFEGGSPLLWQHLFWYFGHPEVYIVILPAMGIASEIISCHARKPVFGYRMMVASMVAIGGLSFLVWAHHMFTSGMNPFYGFVFAVSTLIIAIPSAVKTYNWLLTLWGGQIRFTVPMLFAVGFVSTFVIGGVTGLFLGNVAVDIPLHDTYFVVGHFHLVMGVSAALAIFGGIYHWFPKVTGRMLDERLGRLHFWVTFVGSYLIFFPMLLMGITGVPRRYFAFTGVDFLPPGFLAVNAAITVVALLSGAAQLLFAYNVARSVFRGEPAPPNPWDANSLEWQTPRTPPGHGNWGAEPPAVYRGPYDYSLPGAAADFAPQTVAEVAVVAGGAGSTSGAVGAVSDHGPDEGTGMR